MFSNMVFVRQVEFKNLNETEGIHTTKKIDIGLVGYYVNTTVEHYDNIYVHKGGKLEKHQFLAKMHQIAPNCVSSFKIFPGVTPPDPHPWGGGTSLPRPLPRSVLRASTRMLPLRVSYSSLKQTAG